MEKRGDRQKLRQAQRKQEVWFSSWTRELVRVAKPGGIVAIEAVAKPFCNDTASPGGVRRTLWKEMVRRFHMGVDPASIEIVDYPMFPGSYHVFMRKKG